MRAPLPGERRFFRPIAELLSQEALLTRVVLLKMKLAFVMLLAWDENSAYVYFWDEGDISTKTSFSFIHKSLIFPNLEELNLNFLETIYKLSKVQSICEVLTYQ